MAWCLGQPKGQGRGADAGTLVVAGLLVVVGSTSNLQIGVRFLHAAIRSGFGKLLQLFESPTERRQSRRRQLGSGGLAGAFDMFRRVFMRGKLVSHRG